MPSPEPTHDARPRPHFYPEIVLSDRQWYRVQRIFAAASTKADAAIGVSIAKQLARSRRRHDERTAR